MSANPGDENKLRTVIRLAALDNSFRQRLLSNPRQICDEIGLSYPAGVNIIAIELPADTIAITIPPFSGNQ